MREKELETLIELGLTNLQAKVYLALIRLGDSRAREICRLSEVTRPDIYRVLNELSELGMVEKTFSKPLTFKATPFRNGISRLLEKRDKKTLDLKTNAGKMVRSIEKQGIIPNAMKDFRFIEIPNTGSIIKEDVDLNRIDWQTMDIITLGGRFIRWICANKNSINEVLSKGVRIRIIVGCPQTSNLLIRKQCLNYSNELCKNPLAQVRYIFTDVPALISLYDNKSVRLILKPSQYGCGGVGPDLYSDHPGLAGMARTYFESLWSTAENLN